MLAAVHQRGSTVQRWNDHFMRRTSQKVWLQPGQAECVPQTSWHTAHMYVDGKLSSLSAYTYW